MCGLNGIISCLELDNLHDRIDAMNRSLTHRGPNHGGKYVKENKIALGHRRLSILDLDSRSNQPMFSNSNELVIVYNGEIFNFTSIRNQLDYDFKTDSDTEVIIASLEIKGLDWFLSIANGMFSIAIYNIIENTITLIRDRFSIKPLYYTIVDEVLIFSSEIKGILASGLVEAVFFEEAIDEYLANRYVREPFTFFKNIFQVKGSTYLKFDMNLNYTETCYWTLPELNFSKDFNEEEIIEKANLEIKKAIKRWLVSDVKVGSYLSGGVDSSLTTAIMALDSKNPIHTYTIGFDEEGYDEFDYARSVAKKYNTVHTEIVMSTDGYFEEWNRLIGFKDAPLGVPNEIPLAVMSSKLSHDITVVISGEGADELFGGYGKIYRLAYDLRNNTEIDFYSEFIKSYEYVDRSTRDRYLKTSNLRSYFDTKLQSEFLKYDDRENIFRFFHEYHIKGLLQRVDYTTMQTSVEARPPFLDHELVEYVYKEIPYDLKLKWVNENRVNSEQLLAEEYSEVYDIPKYILKRVSSDYLPNEIIERRKVGFPVPLTAWIPSLESMCKMYLPESKWLNIDKLEELLNELKKNPRAGQLIWMFLNVELFYLKYFKKSWKW
jgi:asparagine synthase (glutamine-hydrolysing)